MTGQFAALTDQGMRRTSNQDAILAEPLEGGWTLAAVADGVGGAFGGEIASSESIAALRATFASAKFEDPAEALRTAFRAANVRVTNRVADDAALANMATTLVAALIRDDSAWVANLGDSRAYLFSGGELQQITEDDSLVAEQVRAGILTPEQAERSPYQNVITRGIGVDQDITEIPVTPVTLPPGSMLLLCSDGLFRPLSLDEIALILRNGSVEEIARQLIDRANANGGPDNISVVLYRQPVQVPTE